MKFHWSKKNSKVAVPVISTGAAMDCPNKAVCPFSKFRTGGRAEGYPVCYGQAGEARFPHVLKLHRQNEKMIRTGKVDPAELAEEVIAYCAKKGIKYVRLNETGDLADWNIDFLVSFVRMLRAYDVKAYTYTKSREMLASQLREAGATVVRSERDFVMVHSKQEARKKGLAMCPAGGCGTTCTRCCRGLQSAVLAH